MILQLTCGHQCTLICHPGACPTPERCVEKIRVRCPCKRRRSDFLCNEAFLGEAKIECDEVCEEIKEVRRKVSFSFLLS